jgi:dihydrofolate synthase / folylpolyglutamate synthase
MFSQLPMFHRIGAAAYRSNLDNTIALSKLAGNPEKKFPSIHIAGTNGKGSVSHLIASVLQSAGYKTGLYTSPHLKDFRERIRMNGAMIPKTYVTSFVSKYRNDFEKLKPSFFEITFAMAMAYFEKEKPDIAVIETGMGGRLDSTNIVEPVLSIITNIGWDHMSFLGDTVEKIAIEKAGIIKKNIPVVIGESQAATDHVFIEKAEQVGTGICFADKDYEVDHFQQMMKPAAMLQMNVSKNNKVYIEDLKTPLAGLYQIKNTVTVLEALEILGKCGFSATKDQIREGFLGVVKNTGLKGRWQIIARKPLTICDTGHNPEGLKEVFRQLRFIPHKELHIVFGMVNDKDISGILDLLPRNASYYFCRPDIPRGLDAELLFSAASEVGLYGKPFPSVKLALAAAREQAVAGDLIFVGGSTFVIAEVV